jgi:RHS repeat-associated protein
VQVLVASQGATATAYLYGVARIGEDDGDWYYHLTDHPSGKPQDYSLGSVRTLAGADGSVGATRAYRPYGTPLHSAGGAASRYGFTGEQTDASGLVYLRARMYAPGLQVFLSRDAWEGDDKQPLTLHPYLYALGNPANLTDPSGYCTSDCERFVEEVDRFITLAKSQKLLWFIPMSDGWTVKMLGSYYSGFILTHEVCGWPFALPAQAIIPVGQIERWTLKDLSAWSALEEPPVQGAKEAALSYGFRRIFYNNTHHYFANFSMAFFFSSWAAREYNASRENSTMEGEHYYFDAAADILIAEVAIRHAEKVLREGIERLPQLLREDACGDSLEEIYEEWIWPNPLVESRLGPPPQ